MGEKEGETPFTHHPTLYTPPPAHTASKQALNPRGTRHFWLRVLAKCRAHSGTGHAQQGKRTSRGAQPSSLFIGKEKAGIEPGAHSFCALPAPGCAGKPARNQAPNPRGTRHLWLRVLAAGRNQALDARSRRSAQPGAHSLLPFGMRKAGTETGAHSLLPLLRASGAWLRWPAFQQATKPPISSGRVFIMNTIPHRQLEPFRQK